MKIVLRGLPSRIGVTSAIATSDLLSMVGMNPGNLAFSYASALLTGFPTCRFWFDAPLDEESVNLFMMANQLGSHYDPGEFIDFLRRLPPAARVLVLGLGAQGPLDKLAASPGDVQLSGAHNEWIRLLEERGHGGTPNVAVRGEYTRQVLELQGFRESVIVLGCPSFMISPHTDLGVRIGKRFEEVPKEDPIIHGGLGNPWQPNHNRFERRMLQLIERSGGKCHVQMVDEHASLARGDSLHMDSIERLERELGIQVPPHSNFRQQARRLFKVWWDVPAWGEYLHQSADFVVSSRIHGTMMALQAGVPALCAVHDSRTEELSITMKIPHVSIFDEPWSSGSFDWDCIRRAFADQFDPLAFDSCRRSRAQGFEAFLLSNEVAVTPHLKRLAQGLPASTPN